MGILAIISRIREMKVEAIQTICSVIQAVFAVVGIFASVAVTWLVWNGSERIAKIEYERFISEAWTAVDSAILSDDDNLRIYESTFAIKSSLPSEGRKPLTPLEIARKREIGYMILNVLATTFAGIDRGIIDKKGMANLDFNLKLLLRDDQTYELSQHGVYQVGFADHCRILKESLRRERGDAENSAQPSMH